MNNFCIKCGNKLNETENFCGKCGQKIKNNNNNLYTQIGIILPPITILILIITLYKGGIIPWIFISSFSITGMIFSYLGLIKSKKTKNTYSKILSIISIILNSLLILITSIIFILIILFLILY